MLSPNSRALAAHPAFSGMRTQLHVLVLLNICSRLRANVQESSGAAGNGDCDDPSWTVPGACWWSVTVDDFEPIKRRFLVFDPRSAVAATAGRGSLPDDPDARRPVLMSFHGQEGDAEGQANYHTFNDRSTKSDLIVVYPQGLDDAHSWLSDEGTGWNCGTAGDNSTCVVDDVVGAGDYNSCRRLQKWGRCNWSTCYDDVLFTQTILKWLQERLRVDVDRVYAQGESNGGMLVHHLAQQLPGTFAAVSPWYGLPLLGYAGGGYSELFRSASEVREVGFLTLHARADTVIPISGGVAPYNKWIYEPLTKVMRTWAAVHGCEQHSSRTPTQWDGGRLSFQCHEYHGCSSGRRIMRCFYDGEHGDYPEDNSGDAILLWFLLQFKRGGGGDDHSIMV